MALALTALNYGALWVFGGRRREGRAFILALCAILVVNYAAFIALNDRYVLSGGDTANDGTVSMERIAKAELLDDHPRREGTAYSYRIDHSGLARNYSMIVNEPSLTSFHSLRSGYLRDFVYQAGFGFDESTTVRPQDGSPVRCAASFRFNTIITSTRKTNRARPRASRFCAGRGT